jgi:hypothetical protein
MGWLLPPGEPVQGQVLPAIYRRRARLVWLPRRPLEPDWHPPLLKIPEPAAPLLQAARLSVLSRGLGGRRDLHLPAWWTPPAHPIPPSEAPLLPRGPRHLAALGRSQRPRHRMEGEPVARGHREPREEERVDSARWGRPESPKAQLMPPLVNQVPQTLPPSGWSARARPASQHFWLPLRPTLDGEGWKAATGGAFGQDRQ